MKSEKHTTRRTVNRGEPAHVTLRDRAGGKTGGATVYESGEPTPPDVYVCPHCGGHIHDVSLAKHLAAKGGKRGDHHHDRPRCPHCGGWAKAGEKKCTRCKSLSAARDDVKLSKTWRGDKRRKKRRRKPKQEEG